MRTVFLSRMVYQTYNGYVMSQFKRMHAHVRNHGEIKWKHVMHLIRLLISGTTVLREGFVPVRVEELLEDPAQTQGHDDLGDDDGEVEDPHVEAHLRLREGTGQQRVPCRKSGHRAGAGLPQELPGRGGVPR